ncbi:MAG: CHAD domain-containing protein, partial [Gemmatimonadales bacterium]|nr:CHAD domain-containing protein [Gemmatimonadales bacterium]
MVTAILTPTLLAQPARLSARVVARAYLQRVLEVAPRVEIDLGEAPSDSEAVHDLRVALRRLRNWLRLWRPFLRDTLTKRSERRLRRISSLAGEARDLEVAHAWLASPATRRFLRVRTAADWFDRRMAVEYRQARRRLSDILLRELSRTAAGLDAELRRYRVEVDLDAPGSDPAMATAVAELLGRMAARLPRALASVRRAGQVDEAHRARIAVKRLRYLLDTFDRSSRFAATAAGPLASFQHLLGNLHDAQLLASRLSTDRAAKTAARRPLRAAVQAALRRRIAALFR